MNEVEQRMIALIEREVDIPDISLDTSIMSLGIDSLEFLNIVQAIRNEIGPVSKDAAFDAQNIRDLMSSLQT